MVSTRRILGALLPTVFLLLVPRLAAAQNPPPVVTPPTQTAAQQAAAAALGRQVTNAQISDAIKQSGLTQDQVRQRLQAAGYDPSLADPFFAAGVQGGSAQTVNSSFVSALQQMGILQPGSGDNSSNNDESTRSNAIRARPNGELTVFGMDVFARASKAFEPMTAGPVDPSYRLGVGDQLQVVFTGDVEMAYSLDIRRDGTVIIPQVGQISVAGLTLEAARALLSQHAERAYSGISSGRTKLDVSLGHIRSVEVYVIGEVQSPGALEVSALSTVFHALARAGGPTVRGSFRDIELRRGGQVIKHFDLYDYLLNGDATSDVRVEQGDVIFVPLNKHAVAFTGAVRRPAVFELKPGEDFGTLLHFAGGLLPNASTDRLQIDRILPPAQRKPGQDRVLIDLIPKDGNLASLDTLQLLDNDVVVAFSIGELRRNMVDLHGEVFLPGRYEWKPGMTLKSLLTLAQGPLPWGITDRIKVVRAVPQTGRSEIFSLDLGDSAQAAFPLQEYDEVNVLDGRLEYPSGKVTVSGAVNRPGSRPFVQHMTLRDAIDLAGGFSERAIRVDIARRVVREGYTDTTSIAFHFPLGVDRDLSPAAAAFVISRGDDIEIRANPGIRPFGSVTVSGAFLYPGIYAIERDGERIDDIIARAGGLRPGADPATFHFTRDGRTVAVSLPDAMRAKSDADFAVRDNDQLDIGVTPVVVLITGAVERPVAVPYHAGWEVADYLDAAGGVSDDGDRNKVIVEDPSGALHRTTTSLHFFRNDPHVQPGSTISVGEKAKDTGGFRDTLASTAQFVSVIVSLAIGYAAIKK